VRLGRRQGHDARDEPEVGEVPAVLGHVLRAEADVADLEAEGRADLGGEAGQALVVVGERADDDVGPQLARLLERDELLDPVVRRVEAREAPVEVGHVGAPRLEVLAGDRVAVPLALVVPVALLEPVHADRPQQLPAEAVGEQEFEAFPEVVVVVVDEHPLTPFETGEVRLLRAAVVTGVRLDALDRRGTPATAGRPSRCRTARWRARGVLMPPRAA
jgi:hypothetical protein